MPGKLLLVRIQRFAPNSAPDHGTYLGPGPDNRGSSFTFTQWRVNQGIRDGYIVLGVSILLPCNGFNSISPIPSALQPLNPDKIYRSALGRQDYTAQTGIRMNDELGQLAGPGWLSQRLKQADQDRGRLGRCAVTCNISHELKTPSRSFRGSWKPCMME